MSNILIVDDDADMQETYSAALERQFPRHVILRALDSQTARALFAAHRDSLVAIVLDGYLADNDPEPTTLELARDIYKSRFAGVVVGASCNPDLLRRFREEGLCGYTVEKHLVPGLLASLIPS